MDFCLSAGIPHPGIRNTRRQARFPALTQFLSAPPAALRPLVTPAKRALNAMRIKPSMNALEKAEKKEHKTAEALDGLFRRIAREEERIREDPVARTTALLKKFFGEGGG